MSMKETPRSGSRTGQAANNGGGPGVNPVVLAFRLEKLELEMKK